MNRLAAAVLALSAVAASQEGPATTRPAQKNPERHAQFLEIVKKGDIDLVFFGDSITDGWRGKNGKKAWDESFAPLKAANFGIGGDRTQHVLWRIQNGELEGIAPKLAVVMIGTNNGGDSAEDVAAGITAIVKEIQKRSPKTKILLLGIFPRNEKPNPGREKNDKVNSMVAKLDDGGKSLKYLDIGASFLQPDKTLSKEVMPDFLHLSEKGYEIWAKAVLPSVKELMGAK